MTTVWEGLARALSPVEARPRVRSHIESAHYKARSGSAYVVIHHPSTRSYARLDPREFEMLGLMDGKHSLKELVIAFYQRHGVLAMARIAGLVSLLREQNFLVGEPPHAYAELGARLRAEPRPRRDGLNWERADLLLGRAYCAWGHVFFRRGWLIAALLVSAVGSAGVVLELQRGRYTLYETGGSSIVGVLVLVGLALAALGIHELGHGLAVKHAGRRVLAAGVRLYFGLPAAFVDTTDIWMAPPMQRLLTAFAGPWTGLMLGGLFGLGALVVDTSGVGAFLYTAGFVFLVDNLFNFNPLLELDGYYMLVDFLDRPLLRARSMAFVRGPLWARLRTGNSLNPEERLLAGFGVASAVYSVLAVLLAVRAWQTLLVPLIATNLASGDVLRQAVGVVVLTLVAVPLALGVSTLLVRSAAPVRFWLEELSGRAARHRHREALAALRAVPVWSELPPGGLLELARALRARSVAPGEEVVRQGDEGDGFYLIDQGAFEVLVNGEPQVRLGRGDFFGERALLERVRRAASVIAIEPGRVFVLARRDFDALLASDIAFRSRVQAALAYRDELRDMPLFHDLAPREVDALVARLVPRSVRCGETIIRQGEVGDRFYVIRSGRLRVERDGVVLTDLGPGEAFGEIALLFDVPRTATVVAVEDARLLGLDAQDFRDVLAGYLGRARDLERLSHLRLSTHRRLDEVVK